MSHGATAASYVEPVVTLSPWYTLAVTESAHYSNYTPDQLADKNSSSIWCALGSGDWVRLQPSIPLTVTSVFIDAGGMNLQGSMDGSSWTTLLTSMPANARTSISNTTAYTYYRILAPGGGVVGEVMFNDDYIYTSGWNNGNFPGWDPFKMTNHYGLNGWANPTSGAAPWYCVVQLTAATVMTKYAILGNVTSWNIYGSNDNSAFTLLDTRTGQNTSTEKSYGIATSTAYLYYKISVNDSTFVMTRFRMNP